MDDGEPNENPVEKVSVLNKIFESLISDASDLVRDLYWGVKTYLFFGLISVLFGIHEITFNMELLQVRLYIPLFVGGALIFCGSVQILNYFKLRKKYMRLFEVQAELSKS